MQLERVEVVLINYKRPENVRLIVDAFRKQTVPCFISLCDLPASPEHSLNDETLKKVDRVFRWNHNFGPFNRYVPNAGYSHEFTYFSDDDMSPGSRCIEFFIEQADRIKRFGVLGQQARTLDKDLVYRPANVQRGKALTQVDFVVRGYFTRTENLYALSVLRNQMGLRPDIGLEDDLLLCVSMPHVCGLPNYLLPANKDKETRMNLFNLSEEGARNQRVDHFADRTDFCKKAFDLGWRPLRWKSGA